MTEKKQKMVVSLMLMAIAQPFKIPQRLRAVDLVVLRTELVSGKALAVGSSAVSAASALRLTKSKAR